MKFTADRDELAAAVGAASQGIPMRPVKPVYAGLLTEIIPPGVVRFTGYDGETVAFQAVAEADTGDEATCVIPGRLLADILKYLPEGQVAVEGDGPAASITAKRAKFTVNTFPAEAFPAVPELSPTALASVPAGDFTASLKHAVTATANNDTRPVLTAVLLKVTDACELTMVGTDRYRMAVSAMMFDGNLSREPALLPASAAERFIRLVGPGGNVMVGWDQKIIRMRYGRVNVVSRHVQGEFPDWRKILDAEGPAGFTFDSEELDRMVRMASLALDEKEPVVLMVDSGLLHVAGFGQPGNSSDSLDVHYGGEPARFLMDPAFLLDGLTGGQMDMSFSSPVKPVFFRDGSTVYMMQPRDPRGAK